MHPHLHDDEDPETPPAVIGAVAAGTGPLPFLAVYAVLFIVHGGFHHVVPPDITGTNRGELIVGLFCLALFVVGTVALIWLLNRHRRWPFVVLQAGFLAVSVDFFLDVTKGGRLVSGLVILTTLTALVLSAHPQTWEHVGRRCPDRLARLFGVRPPPRPVMPAGSQATAGEKPRSARVIGRRKSAR